MTRRRVIKYMRVIYYNYVGMYVVKFVWNNSPAIWIESIYGLAKNRFVTVAQG